MARCFFQIKYTFGILLLCGLMYGCGGNNSSSGQSDEVQQVVEGIPKQEVSPAASPSNNGEYILEKGIFIETPDPNDDSDTRYSVDNKILKVGKTFVYEYLFIDKKGNRLLCKNSEETGLAKTKAWVYAPENDNHPNTIKEVHMTIMEKLGFVKKFQPKFNKTLVQYKFNMVQGLSTYNEQVGVVENEKNMWMTPPLKKLFSILAPNPYPFIQAPFEVGNKWQWVNEVHRRYGDPRWQYWEENVDATHNYEITGKRKIGTAFGELECWVVDATGTSSIANTSLQAYYHEDYGFVTLNYGNLDGSQMVFRLKSIQ